MQRPILSGYMALEGWADDYSEWDGAITGPANPEGANKFWESPIPMIETRALDSLRDENERIKAELEEVKRVLRILRNETKGTLHAHELAIRYDSGNSNWRCLEIALENADAILASEDL